MPVGPYATRSTNAFAQPGKPDMPAPRRSTAQVDADDKAKAKAKDDKKRKREKGIQKAAKAEDQMQQQDDKEQKTRVSRGTRPKTVSTSSTSGRKAPPKRQGSIADADVDATPKRGGKGTKRSSKTESKPDDDDGVSDLTDIESTPVPPKKKPKTKAEKETALRNAIQASRTNNSSAVHDTSDAPEAAAVRDRDTSRAHGPADAAVTTSS